MLKNNHTDANKGEIKGYLYLEEIFGFCKTLKRVTKNLGFQLILNTTDLQDIINTSMSHDINVTINKLHLFISKKIPSVETQLVFNEATQNNYKISFDEYFTESLVISDLIVPHDIGSAQQTNSPKNLISAHQTKDRILTPNKNNNIAILDHIDLRKN